MKKTLFFMMMALVSLTSWTVKPNDWSGKVTDGNNQPLPYVNIVFLSLPDSTFIQGTTTDENGHFYLQTEQNQGVIRASFLGYETAYVQMPTKDDLHIVLSEQSTQLQEVEVKAALPKTKLQNGAMITQVQNSVLEKIGSADDVLSRIPGMMRMGDNLQVIGKGAPTYYINGRKVQDISELKRLQSQDIKQIEVISNPSAAYSAESNAVVKIKTVAKQGEGWGGNVDFSDAQTLRNSNNLMQGQVNLNWRKDNIDVFVGGNLNANNLHNYESELDQQTFSKQTFRQNGTLQYQGANQKVLVNTGMNWRVAENHSLGVRVEHSTTLKDNINVLMEEEMWKNGISQGRMISKREDTDDGSNSLLANAYYNGQVGKLTIDWNTDFYHSAAKTRGQVEEQQPESQSAFQTYNLAKNRLLASKLVLSYPVGKGMLTAGAEMNGVNRTANYTSGHAKIDDTYTKVQEDNIALFADYQTLVPNVGILTAGLRYEHILFDFEPTGGEKVHRNFGEFFPNVTLATRLGQVEAMLSYSLKTKRPTYRELRSGLEYVNPFTFQTGDPTLKNETRQVLDLKMRWRNWAFQAGYERHRNAIYDWTYPYDDQGTVVINMVNFKEPLNLFSAFLVYSPQVGCWTSSNVVGFQHGSISFLLDDPREASGKRRVNYDKPMYIFNSNNAFRLKKSWILEMNSEFYTKADFGNAHLLTNYWNLSLAVQKSWLKDDALTLRLSCSDIFRQADLRVLLDLGNYTLMQSNINGQSRDLYEQQRLTLSLKYKFNTNKNRYKGKSAAGTIIERM